MAQPSLPLPVSEGVHLRMPSHIFDGARALGAEDLRRLYWDAPAWWASTEYNPHRRQPPRAVLKAGHDVDEALATLLLQGGEAYAARFAVEPDDARSDLARTREEVKAVLAEHNVKIPYGDFTDKTMFGLVRRHGLSHRVFAVARQDYERAKARGLGYLSEDDDRRVRAMARLMTGHKEVGPVFSGGLSDVAVFWRRAEDPETLLRTRFRKLRRRRTFELVPLVGWQARDPEAAVRQTIRDHDLEISRCLQHAAFEALARFVSAGTVFAWDDTGLGAHVLQDERDALGDIVASGTPAWVWLFYQLPVNEAGRERGTVVAPRLHAPEGRLWDIGLEKIEAALAEFRKFRASYSLDRPWVLVQDLSQLVDEDVSPRVKKEAQ